MREFKNSLSCKLVSVMLSLLILLSVLPASSIAVFATDEEILNAVTITVTNEEGTAIVGATVNYFIDSIINGEDYIVDEKETDENGCVQVPLPMLEPEDVLTMTATISKEGYNTDYTSIANFGITDLNQNISVELIRNTITDVIVTGEEDITYDGEWHTAVNVIKQASDVVSYEYDSTDVRENANGDIQVKNAGIYTFYVTVTRDGYEPYTATVTTTVNKAEITDVTITGKSDLKYNETEQKLVTVTGIKSTDIVTYEVNDEETTLPYGEVPTEKAIGTYNVKIKVDRGSNYKIFEKSVAVNIDYGILDLGDLKIKGLDLSYTGEEQDSVSVSNQGNYNLKFKLGEDGEWIDTIPKVIDGGSYTVYVMATKEFYQDVEDVVVKEAYNAKAPFNVYVGKANQSIVFSNAEYVDGESTEIVLNTENLTENIYDFSATGGNTSEPIVYEIKNASSDGISVDEIADIDRNTGKLTVKSAGCITITATKPGDGNYNDAPIIHNVTITVSNDDLISFSTKQIDYVFGENNGLISDNRALPKNTDDLSEVRYSIDRNNIGVSCDSTTGKIEIDNYDALNNALYNNDGTVAITVTAEKSAYNVTSEILQRPVQPENTNAVYFSNANNWGEVYIHCWGGSSNISWPGIEMTPVIKNIHNEMVYRAYVPNDVTSIVFNNNDNGKKTEDITSSIYDKVNFYPKNNSDICSVDSVTWTINDPHELVMVPTEKYGADSDSYTINISYANKPANPYSLQGVTGDNDWYKTSVTVKPTDAENYTISKGVNPDSFSDYVEYSEEGTADRYVYLRNSSGGITSKIKLEGLKIDTVPVDVNNMRIEYSEPNLIEKIGKLFGFCNPDVTVTFIVDDENTDVESGVQYLNWTYTKSNDATTSILGTKTDKITEVEKIDNKYVASITITADEAEQYRGNISFNVTDNAGNHSEEITDEGIIIVIDTINPKMTAKHQLVNPENFYNKVNNQHYYSNEVEFTFEVIEANFFEDDFKVKMSKDNAPEQVVDVTWSHNDETHIGTFKISGDGNYKVSMNYTDQSGNVVTHKDNGEDIVHYESEIITIDTIAPKLDFEFNRDNQSVKFIVTEHNFRPEDITVKSVATNLLNRNVVGTSFQNILRAATWVSEGENTYSYIIEDVDDAIYDLKISYQDLSKNNAEPYKTGKFIVDASKPTDISISYSKSMTDTVLEVLTLGFYKPDVTVTFTAYDLYSGVKSFTWNYTKQDGASDINRPTDQSENTIKAEPSVTDKSKFTAVVTLPNDDYTQLRGYIAAYATDEYGNIGEKVTDDNKIIVVDTITPTIKVDYSPVSRTVGNIDYYNGDIDITFNVKESNFFAEDVKVKVIKNGQRSYDITPVWTDKSVDEHIGTYTLTGDGYYIITVEYMDRSSNEMVKYVSNKKTIDTIKPKIKADYQNDNIINTLKDNENNDREYYDDVQTAVITITEHNFNANEVKFTITGKDVSGNEVSLDDIVKKSRWSNNGDTHTITITYSGDANYSFDVEYTDLATNKADDYKLDCFTVDKTAPENLTVNYSTSVLETTLENITFGFYKSNMTVTITADDQTSKINNFNYSYIKANNVSDVNAQLLDQIIGEADIAYSNADKTATTTFQIPKEVLQGNNQFNGIVEFTAKDRSGNSTDQKATHRVVVDNIAPTATIYYNEPINTENNISYYDGDIQATIVINEANFHSNDVSVMISREGGEPYKVIPNWVNNSVDFHTGTFTLKYDGDYVVNVSYKDKSGNEMATYKSNQLTIDTGIAKPTIRINGKEESGKAYKDIVIPTVTFYDKNFANYEISLTRTNYGNKNVDVTKAFIGNSVVTNGTGGSGTFDKFEKLAVNDGIYRLTVKMTDKAGHSSETSADFTVNRFGSVYEYSDYLSSLIKDGGSYISVVDQDFVITEYNADKLVENSLNIVITRDGKPLSEVKYDVTPVINDRVSVGARGWYQYSYIISKDNFSLDGVYKISVSSKDATGNSPENTNYKSKDILFRVDSTAPEISSIVGLETKIINAQEALVKYTIFDTIGLKSVKIFVDNNQIGDTITDFKSDMNNYTGSFVIKESNTEQEVRFVVEDLAGNVTDTDSETFTSAYAFEKAVTVSTNAFVRWYANKVLFWGSIGGFVAVSAIITTVVIILVKKRKKNQE